ncbi:MAG: DUF4041 domain-containing protein [Phycisphaerales bacterium]
MSTSGVIALLFGIASLLGGGVFLALWLVARQEIQRIRGTTDDAGRTLNQLVARQTELESRLKQEHEARRALYEEAKSKLTLATQQLASWKAKYERIAHWEAAQSFREQIASLQVEVEDLQRTANALRNTIDGYGSRYVVPPQSALDDLAKEAAHTSPGQKLREAREASRRMAREGRAATCDYVQGERAENAAAFVLDAFNGKIESILDTVKDDNVGTIIQKVKDAWQLVNAQGQAFRNARITPDYLEARLEEARWAALVQKIKLDQREEQRRLKEQMREEAKAQREFERAERETRKQEAALARERELIERAREAAMLEERARQEARLREELAKASEDQRAAIEARFRAQVEQELSAAEAKYTERLADADARIRELEALRERAKSMAQQTKAGTVYVISNLGSFGEGVYKIGQTRRLDPMERVHELGDASVPFGFDVHALIRTDNAPFVEGQLHERFVLNQVNKMNWRKEFFRTDLASIRSAAEELGLVAEWTLESAAQQYRETQALEAQMAADPQLKARWVAEQTGREFEARDSALPPEEVDDDEGGEISPQ